MTKEKRATIFAWLFFGLIAASVIGAVVYEISTRSAGDPFLIPELLIKLVPLTFAFVGALIISRQPRNVIGLLMMLPGTSLFVLVDAIMLPYVVDQLPPPEIPSALFLLTLWFSNWNWLLLVFPLMFIMVLFPTGYPINPRWGWLIHFGLGIMVVFILLITFAESLTYGSGGVDWVLDNPIGFIPSSAIDKFVAPFVIAMPIWVFLCVVALLVRFRRSRNIERQQIKWLLYAAMVFALFYVPSFIESNYSDIDSLWNFLFIIGLLAFPAGIAIAILRYRLYDIDIIIRKTLQYVLLTGLLALVYFGSVILLQSLAENLTGQQSPFVIVFSTLAIAALFNPLRIRVQDFIDRRFYRKKYDAEQTLARFAMVARDEVNMDKLSAAMLAVVDETMQPEQASLWLKSAEGRR